jgi:hypothetical protein
VSELKPVDTCTCSGVSMTRPEWDRSAFVHGRGIAGLRPRSGNRSRDFFCIFSSSLTHSSQDASSVGGDLQPWKRAVTQPGALAFSRGLTGYRRVFDKSCKVRGPNLQVTKLSLPALVTGKSLGRFLLAQCRGSRVKSRLTLRPDVLQTPDIN